MRRNVKKNPKQTWIPIVENAYRHFKVESIPLCARTVKVYIPTISFDPWNPERDYAGVTWRPAESSRKSTRILVDKRLCRHLGFIEPYLSLFPSFYFLPAAHHRQYFRRWTAFICRVTNLQTFTAAGPCQLGVEWSHSPGSICWTYLAMQGNCEHF